MNPTIDPAVWQNANSTDLAARLARIRALLQTALGREAQPLPDPPPTDTPTAALLLGDLFNLSPFEIDLLLLCAGAEMDSAIATLCAEMNGDPRQVAPTFAVALSALPNAHWSALTSNAPLRHWHMLEPGAGDLLTRAALRIDERILHFLAGVSVFDARLEDYVTPVANAPLSDSGAQREAQERLASLLTSDPTPVIALWGADRASLVETARAAAALCGMTLFTVRAADLPTDPHERHTVARLWQREAVLIGAALLVEGDSDPRALATFSAFAAEGAFPLFLASEQPVALTPINRHIVRFLAERPTAAEQQITWQSALGQHGLSLNGYVPALTAQFQLPPSLIHAAAAEALAGLSEDLPAGELKRRLWDSSRRQARPNLDDLALRIESQHGWDDLVLPQDQMNTLREITVHVAQRQQVYEAWGFGANTRGTGTGVVFAGGSGTGKTLAAEIIANVLRLDLYRVDLAGVVSKYIGETEKNLRRIFTAAEYGGAILLFDEADALFGKRSEVRDSHDRYANIEVSFLLQQMESYRGLAILTTNMLDALDRAFLRRLRFVVQFPFPDPEQRREIWTRIFPPEAPLGSLDWYKLARLNVTGGSIRNIALNAAFLAADAQEPIGMNHLLRATTGEFAKLEKPLSKTEIGDWIDDHA